MATYDIVQSAFLMAKAANGAWGINDTQPNLVAALTTFLNGGTDINNHPFQGFFPRFNPDMPGGDWKVVWGPCVYLEGGGTGEGTNAMFVAYSRSQLTYVVAVAGTDFKSLYDWIEEDGEVDPSRMVPWPPTLPYTPPAIAPGIPTVAALSEATTRGLSNLLCASEMRDPSSGDDLQTFLAAQMNGQATLIFTGHSLGGALAPTLALYLYARPPQQWRDVLILPVAGASPGNAQFAAEYNKAFPPIGTRLQGRPYPNWNVDYANTHDVVPHAWNQLAGVVTTKVVNSRPQFDSFYGALSDEIGTELFFLVAAAMTLVRGGNYMSLNQKGFEPSWGHWAWIQSGKPGYLEYPPVWTRLPSYTQANPIETNMELAVNVEAAHIDQYASFFGVLPAQPLPTTSKAEEQDAPVSARTARKRMLLAAARLEPRETGSVH